MNNAVLNQGITPIRSVSLVNKVIVVDDMKMKSLSKIVEIPFEKFVLNPDSYIKRISDSIDVMPDHITKKEMRKQGVPRRSTTDAPYNSVYARYGWEKPKRHLSFLDEVDETGNKLKKVLPAKAMLLLESITSNYINRYNF